MLKMDSRICCSGSKIERTKRMMKKYTEEQRSVAARCRAYDKLHQLSQLLYNAPLGLIEYDDPTARVAKKLEEAIQICNAAHELAKKQEPNHENE